MIPAAATDMEEMIMTVPISDTATLEGGLLVRKATGQDRAAVVETLTTAFFDDPVMSWWVLDPARRSEILRAFFEIIVDVNHPHDELYTTSTVPAAAAVWVPPGCQPSLQPVGRNCRTAPVFPIVAAANRVSDEPRVHSTTSALDAK